MKIKLKSKDKTASGMTKHRPYHGVSTGITHGYKEQPSSDYNWSVKQGITQYWLLSAVACAGPIKIQKLLVGIFSTRRNRKCSSIASEEQATHSSRNKGDRKKPIQKQGV